jgi:hypothetical protein
MPYDGSVADSEVETGETLTSHSTLLRQKIQLVSPCTAKNSPSLLTHPRLREFYGEMLFVLYCTIRANVPMMQAARDCARPRSSNDRAAAKLASYLDHHIGEEMHHDEWLLEDMEVLGFKRDAVWKRIPPVEVAALVGAQFYWIQYAHPVAILGYIAALECDPTPESAVEEAIRNSGLPAAAFRTILMHSRLDPLHRDDFNAMLDGLPLTEDQSSLIGISAFHTACTLNSILAAVRPE